MYLLNKKIYNKFVQMLECKSVRNSVGCHWKDWVCQTGTRLANARDKAKTRGLTRAEWWSLLYSFIFFYILL